MGKMPFSGPVCYQLILNTYKSMKKLWLLLFTLSAINVGAQEENKDQGTAKTFRRWSLGVTVSPDYNYRTLKKNQQGGILDTIFSYRQGMETAKAGYTAGINVMYHLSNCFSLETGLQFSNKGFKTLFVIDSVSATNPPFPTSVVRYDRFYYLDIPLKASFTFGTGKLQFCAGAGITANFLIQNSVYSFQKFRDGSRKEFRMPDDGPYNTFNLSPMLSAGIDYSLSNRAHLKAEPTFRYGILQIMDAPISAYLWNAGLNLGFYYSL
jgi:hypothetical protein